MIQELNAILSIPRDFPQIPTPRKDCHIFYVKPNERHKQMVICPEQDCEWLVYMSDLDTCVVEALGVQDHPLWQQRVQEFKEWQKKNSRISKSTKEAWTWEGSNSDKWSTTSTKGSSKRGQSVPVDLSKRTNPEEKGLAWRELDELDTSIEFLFPETSLPCPVDKSIPLPPEKQADYIHWIVRSFKLDHKVDKDPRPPLVHTATWITIRDSLASMLRSTGSLMKDIIVLYVQPNILHFFVLVHKSTEVQANQTGRNSWQPKKFRFYGILGHNLASRICILETYSGGPRIQKIWLLEMYSGGPRIQIFCILGPNMLLGFAAFALHLTFGQWG